MLVQPGQTAVCNTVHTFWCLGHFACLLHAIEAFPHALVHPRSVVRTDRCDERAAPDESDAVFGDVAGPGSRLGSGTQERQDRLHPSALAGPLAPFAAAGLLAVHPGETLWVHFEARWSLFPSPPLAERLNIFLPRANRQR